MRDGVLTHGSLAVCRYARACVCTSYHATRSHSQLTFIHNIIAEITVFPIRHLFACKYHIHDAKTQFFWGSRACVHLRVRRPRGGRHTRTLLARTAPHIHGRNAVVQRRRRGVRRVHKSTLGVRRGVTVRSGPRASRRGRADVHRVRNDGARGPVHAGCTAVTSAATVPKYGDLAVASGAAYEMGGKKQRVCVCVCVCVCSKV